MESSAPIICVLPRPLRVMNKFFEKFVEAGIYFLVMDCTKLWAISGVVVPKTEFEYTKILSSWRFGLAVMNFLHECLGLLMDMLRSVKTTERSTEWKVRICLTCLSLTIMIISSCSSILVYCKWKINHSRYELSWLPTSTELSYCCRFWLWTKWLWRWCRLPAQWQRSPMRASPVSCLCTKIMCFCLVIPISLSTQEFSKSIISIVLLARLWEKAIMKSLQSK